MFASKVRILAQRVTHSRNRGNPERALHPSKVFTNQDES